MILLLQRRSRAQQQQAAGDDIANMICLMQIGEQQQPEAVPEDVDDSTGAGERERMEN